MIYEFHNPFERDPFEEYRMTPSFGYWLLVYAAMLMQAGVEPVDACRMALVRPITDDADIRETLDHAIDAVFDAA